MLSQLNFDTSYRPLQVFAMIKRYLWIQPAILTTILMLRSLTGPKKCYADIILNISSKGRPNLKC